VAEAPFAHEPSVGKASALGATVIVRMSARLDFMGSFQFGCCALGQFSISDPAGRLCTAKTSPFEVELFDIRWFLRAARSLADPQPLPVDELFS
jgi:hypothetical protein